MGTFKNTVSEAVEFMKVEDDLLVVGVKAQLFNRIGEIKNIDLPEEGSEVAKGDECVFITGVEEDLHLRAPIHGVVLEVNDLFSEDLEKHKDDPDYFAWVFKIEPSDIEDLVEFEE
jgi:glycine cleavage system H protein